MHHRHQLHRDVAGADPRQLPHPPHLLLRPPVLRGGAAARVQAVPAYPKVGGTASGQSLSAFLMYERPSSWTGACAQSYCFESLLPSSTQLIGEQGPPPTIAWWPATARSTSGSQHRVQTVARAFACKGQEQASSHEGPASARLEVKLDISRAQTPGIRIRRDINLQQLRGGPNLVNNGNKSWQRLEHLTATQGTLLGCDG